MIGCNDDKVCIYVFVYVFKINKCCRAEPSEEEQEEQIDDIDHWMQQEKQKFKNFEELVEIRQIASIEGRNGVSQQKIRRRKEVQ